MLMYTSKKVQQNLLLQWSKGVVFYSKEVLATIIVILTGFTVLQAYFLQKIEAKLGNK